MHICTPTITYTIHLIGTGCYRIAYRILLTISVTVDSVERSFSNLKLIKSYLRSTMSQERLNGLTILSIEKHMLEQIDSNSLIIDFFI